MARKKAMTEAELLLEREKIDRQILEIRERENMELGELVKKVFGKLLPDSKAGRVTFFKELKQSLDAKNVNVVSGVVKSESEPVSNVVQTVPSNNDVVCSSMNGDKGVDV